MSDEEVLFKCLACKRPLVAARKYIDCKVRCASCNLAMLVPISGHEARYFDPKEASLRHLDTQEIQVLRNLSSSSQTLRKSLSDEGEKQETQKSDEDKLSIHDTQEIKALSTIGRDLVEGEKIDSPEIELNLLVGNQRIHPPRPKTEKDLPIQVEKFRDEGLFEDTYLKPKRVVPSKTIRGERQSPPIQVKKTKVNFLRYLLCLLFVGVLAFILIKKPSLNEVYQFLRIEHVEPIELQQP